MSTHPAEAEPRRTFLTSPGEQLLLPHTGEDPEAPLSILTLAERLDRWIASSGLTAAETIFNPMIATPLPDYEAIEPGRRRWAGVSPTLMWHPLMWLPEHLAHRLLLVDPDTGETSLEGTDAWVLRVAIELTVNRLYDPADGWLDVLAVHDLDIDDPDVIERVALWLEGAQDPELDQVSIDGLLTPTPEWGSMAAESILGLALSASWHYIAADLLAMVVDADTDDEDQLLLALRRVKDWGTTLAPDAPLGFGLTLGAALDGAVATLHELSSLEELERAADIVADHLAVLETTNEDAHAALLDTFADLDAVGQELVTT